MSSFKPIPYLAFSKNFRPKKDLLFALKTSLPIFFAFFPVGVAFGVLATSKGLSPIAAFCMSFFIYAGSSEFLIASMIVGFESLLEIALTSFFVNFRHVFYGLSVNQKIPPKGVWRYYVIATLSDEAFSLLTTLKEDKKSSAIWISFLIHFYWFGSVIFGSLAGGAFGLNIKGLDFCLPALFAVLTVAQAQEVKKATPFAFAAVAMTLSFIFAPSQFLVVSILLSLLFIIIGHKKGWLV